jgi:hypothetical protein
MQPQHLTAIVQTIKSLIKMINKNNEVTEKVHDRLIRQFKRQAKTFEQATTGMMRCMSLVKFAMDIQLLSITPGGRYTSTTDKTIPLGDDRD